MVPRIVAPTCSVPLSMTLLPQKSASGPWSFCLDDALSGEALRTILRYLPCLRAAWSRSWYLLYGLPVTGMLAFPCRLRYRAAVKKEKQLILISPARNSLHRGRVAS
ncbi:hypothetical protein DPX16_21834 [Anabarilius grahami]|uniref:Uncharacterized protein n=1 Tax=Anabarilius grahami TaxID=495550 RepID=A0A3N0YRP0_ANAGA|nr:hypothetical protein DPX16_21834 [Anabarilius grahami]